MRPNGFLFRNQKNVLKGSQYREGRHFFKVGKLLIKQYKIFIQLLNNYSLSNCGILGTVENGQEPWLDWDALVRVDLATPGC